MSRQFYNPAPVLHDILGIDPAFNGTLAFYEVGTSTPKNTWSDYAQTVLNPNPVLLDSAARSATQIWLDGEYTVVLRNADVSEDVLGEIVWTRDLRPEQAGSDELPAKEDGKFLTTDGENWLMGDVRQVPDPTGFGGRILSNDGANVIWVTAASVMPPPPTPPEPDWNIGTNSFKLGDYLKQWGTGTGPATNTDFSSVAITFPQAFDTAPHYVGVTVTTANINGTSLVAIGVTNITTTGCTVNFNNADRHYYNTSISSSVPFQWIAEGKKA